MKSISTYLLALIVAVFGHCVCLCADEVKATATTNGPASKIDASKVPNSPSNASGSNAALAESVLKIELPGTAGQNYSLAEEKQPIVVFFFLGLECPVANTYVSEVHAIKKKFASEKISWVGIHSEGGVTAKAATKHSEDYKL